MLFELPFSLIQVKRSAWNVHFVSALDHVCCCNHYWDLKIKLVSLSDKSNVFFFSFYCFPLAHLESSIQLKGDRISADKDSKSALPEETLTSHKRHKLKHSVVPEIEVSTSKKSKLGKESTKDTNVLSESKEQLPFADTTWKRKRKSVVSKVNIFFACFIEHVLYRVCFWIYYFFLFKTDF